MSAILAVCGDAFCAMVSDGRYVEEPITGDKPHIISDELPKVRKVNRNVLVGFAGDTLAAVDKYDIADDISYISTGGGAFLEFLEGKELPAVAALQVRGG